MSTFSTRLAGVTAGIGTGAVTATTLALIQDQSPPEQLGVATSAAAMLRDLGPTAGVNGIAALSAALATTSHQGRVMVVLTPAVVAPRRRTTG
ncbi:MULTISPECIES: hypothetical protein [Streptomyces]|uniref:Uncharacterized protein n=1 Tax=Streptomyces canarius TaxID=285453 RepID=A0ABQ3DAR9_9ACTN|nr:hypothetical protein [Streptomyces canarius]GHA68736.1 hypothetical protein GCM10010345_85460 [Streptomyces canarius]